MTVDKAARALGVTEGEVRTAARRRAGPACTDDAGVLDRRAPKATIARGLRDRTGRAGDRPRGLARVWPVAPLHEFRNVLHRTWQAVVNNGSPQITLLVWAP